jgi:rRNA biogenesis protein RRP5
MFAITCKKFKSKKKVWIAHAAYLLRNGKYEESLAVSKRALLSLPQYKHTEMMSRMAQLMYEHERVDQARTIFDGLLVKNPKRLDILSVYIDKEVKHGSIEVARQLFKDIAGSANSSRCMKLSEKQMKKLFKRWYAFEEDHGTNETCDAVKQAAVEYVEGK